MTATGRAQPEPVPATFDARLAAAPVVAIVRLPAGLDAATPARVVAEAGVGAVEVSLTTPGALVAVRTLRDAGLTAAVGVGTVRTTDDVRRSHEAGAEFLVTPTTDPAVLDLAAALGLPVVAGGLTPTELETARRHGAAYQKVFPASAFGPSYLREVLAPLTDLRLVPTGGVTPELVPAYREAGAVAVGAGSALIDARTVADGNWDELRRRTDAFLAAWHHPLNRPTRSDRDTHRDVPDPTT